MKRNSYESRREELGGDDVDDAVGNHSTSLLGTVTLHKGVLEAGEGSIVIEVVESIEFDLEITLHDEVFVITTIRNGREVLLLVLGAGGFEVFTHINRTIAPEGVSQILEILAVVEADTDGVATRSVLQEGQQGISFAPVGLRYLVSPLTLLVTKDDGLAAVVSTESHTVAFAI